MASFPTSAISYATLVDLVDSPLAAHENSQGDEITAVETFLVSAMHGWNPVSDSWTINSQAYTNDPAAGTSITLNMTDTSKFAVNDFVIVSSSAGVETALVTSLVANTSITVDSLSLNHTTTSPVVIACSITVPSGAASLYRKGDKIKLTQSTVKYFYIISVADTVLKITGGDDYVLTTGALSSICISHTANPIGFPTWMTWTPTITGFSANPTLTNYRFRVTGDACDCIVSQQSAGTSNATSFTVSSPVVCKSVSNLYWILPCIVTDNGSTQATPGRIYIGGGASATFYVQKDVAGTAFTGSGGKSVITTVITYEI